MFKLISARARLNREQEALGCVLVLIRLSVSELGPSKHQHSDCSMLGRYWLSSCLATSVDWWVKVDLGLLEGVAYCGHHYHPQVSMAHCFFSFCFSGSLRQVYKLLGD